MLSAKGDDLWVILANPSDIDQLIEMIFGRLDLLKQSRAFRVLCDAFARRGGALRFVARFIMGKHQVDLGERVLEAFLSAQLIGFHH